MDIRMSRTKTNGDNSNMSKSISDVPNEVIQKFILVHLSCTDLRSFGMTGCKRFKVIADDVLGKRRKSTLCNTLCISIYFIRLDSNFINLVMFFFRHKHTNFRRENLLRSYIKVWCGYIARK